MDFKLLTPSHEDLVNDIAFDYYGKRFASCSSDKHIKIWTLDDESGNWTSVDISRAHQDSIWRLSWANPEFGQLIASCSEDNTICIWEEQESIIASDSSRERWIRKIKLSNSKKSVNDVKFSHRSLGLKLASASADGYIRIFEAPDVFDLNKWDMMVSTMYYW
jgi:WD40 repeat protein